MSKRSLVGIFIFVVFLFVAIGIGLLIFRYIERQAQIDFGQDVVTTVIKEIKELKELGFSEQDEAVRALRSRAKRSQHKIKELQKNWHAFTRKRTVQNIDTKKLARLIQLNKKMIRSYAQDVNEYQKLGLPDNNKVVLFAKDNLVKLAMALNDLKRQYAAFKKGEDVSSHQVQRIKRMIEINKQSMEHYKTVLNEYANQNLAFNVSKVQLAKKQLTQKARAINALEKLLE